ncbi:trehalose-phosphatase [Haladaptatus pallidirubidus]|uniref:Trehalose 6-phosphate phosphatase n=1 Tax=Haladaptatus pallidirubidus TaxID=1008152 RepID=A0AAV3UMT5_9EURY|nr:trehalose-phosphatase [Haladaptatus pallidirubidus]
MTDQVPESLRTNLYVLVNRLRDTDGLLAMFDFDGSLAPIENRPEDVELPPATRTALEELRGTEDVEVGVVSGRGLNDLRERVGIDGITYAGNHGLELYTDDERKVHPVAKDSEDEITSLSDELESELADVDGAFVENKGVTASVHYRLVEDAEGISAVQKAVENAVRESDDIRVTSGKQVLELRPDVEWHKGRAIRWLYDHHVPNDETWLPLYVGDDRTDEDAFETLPKSGLGVKVGRQPPTVAGYHVTNPSSVQTVLAWLVEYGVGFLGGKSLSTGTRNP